MRSPAEGVKTGAGGATVVGVDELPDDPEEPDPDDPEVVAGAGA